MTHNKPCHVICPDLFLTCLEARMRCMTGKAYAAVFPDPVLARARRSFPSKANGMAFSWIRVGWDQPRSATAWKRKVARMYASELIETITTDLQLYLGEFL